MDSLDKQHLYLWFTRGYQRVKLLCRYKGYCVRIWIILTWFLWQVIMPREVSHSFRSKPPFRARVLSLVYWEIITIVPSIPFTLITASEPRHFSITPPDLLKESPGEKYTFGTSVFYISCFCRVEVIWSLLLSCSSYVHCKDWKHKRNFCTGKPQRYCRSGSRPPP